MTLKTKPPYDLVIGLGASGMAMAEYLKKTGRNVVATDLDASKTDVAEKLGRIGIQTQIGFHDSEVFNHAQRLIPSPGIPPQIPLIQNAVTAGALLTGELDIFFAANTLPVIAVSGTNGKTTTTTLVGEMLKACGKNPFVGGNIGTPLVTQLSHPAGEDIIVAELSSFQLDLSRHFRPDVGVLLNISEDHLDRYASYAAYEQSKWSLFARQQTSDTAIINADIRNSDEMARTIASNILLFSSKKSNRGRLAARISKNGIKIQLNEKMTQIAKDINRDLMGAHNLENISAAFLACLSAGGDMASAIGAVKDFKNLDHRLAHVSTIRGVQFFNDSKATNTDAVIRALQCFDTPVILILGGRAKGTDFSLLTCAIQENTRAIVAIGETKAAIAQAFSGVCNVYAAESMADAVQKSFDLAQENENVLLSPACASFDMYENYAHRGDDFIHKVNLLKEQMI